MKELAIIVVAIYTFSLVFILSYSIVQLNLVFNYLKNKFTSRRNRQETQQLPAMLPQVTVQLPIYNEYYVVERLIDAVSRLNYPKDKLQIQILDDSTDET